jgi:hypothetical protein
VELSGNSRVAGPPAGAAFNSSCESRSRLGVFKVPVTGLMEAWEVVKVPGFVSQTAIESAGKRAGFEAAANEKAGKPS